jgi:DNA-binding NtrC family response regulator
MRGEKLLGLIYLDTRGIPTRFTDLERSFVDAFANQVALAIENARVVGDLRSNFQDLKTRVGERYNYTKIIGPGGRMQDVFRQIEKAAPTDTSILLTGENGTGKDLAAGLIHELSPRKDGPFVIVNCPAIAKDLVESELFGIEKSVATGVAPRSGFFERADGGTIFLNEIGDLPHATQVRVLQVIDKKQFERVGGSKVINVDVRVISATNQDLRKLIENGSFRKDLYFRLNHIQIALPPLRERMEDLPDLIAHFIHEYAAKNRKSVKRVSKEVLDVLKKYHWPGNVRELERCIERAVVFAEAEEITPGDLSEEITQAVASDGSHIPPDMLGRTLPEMKAAFETHLIEEALRKTRWVKSRAALSLGIHEATLRKKMKSYGIVKPPNQ